MSSGASPDRGLDVVVFTSALLGLELAAALASLDEVRSLHLITTARSAPRPTLARLRRRYRLAGPPAILRTIRLHLPRWFRPATRPRLVDMVSRRCPAATHLHFRDLHAPACLARLRALRPDIAVVFGCYRLRPELYGIPRLGTLNLHLGKAPEFRGSSPGFYEMLDGVPEVGVTVHQVNDALDGGPILSQRTFPLDLAPAEDPLRYLARLEREVLVPNGIRMMMTAVRLAARDQMVAVPQPAPGSRPRPTATWALKRRLRRVVAARRRATGMRAVTSRRTSP